MNLYEKIQTTVPGRHAVAIGEALYDHSGTIGQATTDKLVAAQTYLEALAIAEIEGQLEQWVRELKVKNAGIKAEKVLPAGHCAGCALQWGRECDCGYDWP